MIRVPKVKPLTHIPQNELDLLQEISIAQSLGGLSYRQLCERAGLSYATFMRHKREPGDMRFDEYWQFMKVCETEAQKRGRTIERRTL